MPDAPPPSDLSDGTEVLCRHSEITGLDTLDPKLKKVCEQDPDAKEKGCWMEGMIVGKAPGDSVVCKLNDKSRALMPFTPYANIRPLCFAKAADPVTGATCKPGSEGCPTCAPYCEVDIDSPGKYCPQQALLGMDLLKYHTDKEVDNLYHPGQVTGMYFKNKADLEQAKELEYQIDYEPAPSHNWGPQPGGKQFILPSMKFGADGIPAISNQSYGWEVVSAAFTDTDQPPERVLMLEFAFPQRMLWKFQAESDVRRRLCRAALPTEGPIDLR